MSNPLNIFWVFSSFGFIAGIRYVSAVIFLKIVRTFRRPIDQKLPPAQEAYDKAGITLH